MKVLMISTDLALLGESAGTGDAWRRHRDYGRHLDRLDIVVFSRRGYQPRVLSANVFTYPVNARIKWLNFYLAFRAAVRLFTDRHYDLVVCQDPFLTGLAGCLLQLKFSSKLLVHFHGDFWQNKYWLKERPANHLLFWLSKLVVRRASAIRVVSPGIKNKLCRRGIAAGKIKIIPTPVDLSSFNQPDNQTVNSIRQEFSGYKILFWAGRLSPEKNLPWLLGLLPKIIATHPKTILLLAGDGRQRKLLEQLSVKLGLVQHLKIIGRLEYRQLVNYYHASDIFVFPSLHESFGKVLVEAAAAARPAVASATTGAKNIIKDKQTGFLVPVNNQKQFIAKVSSLLASPELAEKMGLAAYNYISQKFNYQNSIDQIVGYWRSVIGGLKLSNHRFK